MKLLLDNIHCVYIILNRAGHFRDEIMIALVATQVLMRIENAGSYTNSSGVFTYTDLWDFFGLNGILKRVVWYFEEGSVVL